MIEITNTENSTCLINPQHIVSVVDGYYSNRPTVIRLVNGRTIETYTKASKIAGLITESGGKS